MYPIIVRGKLEFCFSSQLSKTALIIYHSYSALHYSYISIRLCHATLRHSIVLQSLLLPSSSPAITILKLPPTGPIAIWWTRTPQTDNATTASDNSRAVNTAADLAKLRNAGKPLSSQELKDLNARIKAFEEMAKLEDRLRALESRKRPRSQESSDLTLPPEDPTAPTRPAEAPLPSGGSSSHRQTHRRSETRLSEALLPSRRPSSHHRTHTHSSTDDSDSSSSTTVTHHRHKRPRYTKGIKVTPSYTLKVSSSLREWGDWKKDIERVFEGDPYTYRTGSQRILKALDYLDSNLKSLWYTFNDQQKGIGKWSTFINWTKGQHPKRTECYCYPIRTIERCKAIARPVSCQIQRLLIRH